MHVLLSILVSFDFLIRYHYLSNFIISFYRIYESTQKLILAVKNGQIEVRISVCTDNKKHL